MSKDIERARIAAQVLDNQIFVESFAVLKEGYVQALMACDPKDDLGRARYAFALRDLQTIKNHITTVLNRGEIAAHEAEEMKRTTNIFQRAARGFA